MQTGCMFASRLAVDSQDETRKPQLIVAPGLPAQDFTGFFESCAQKEKPAMVLLPKIRTQEEVVDFLNELGALPKWTCQVVDVEGYPFPDALVQVRWDAPNGMKSEAMGFAPFSIMPVTRRAPYVALALWPGSSLDDSERLYPRKEDGVMEFLDTAHPFAADEIQDFKDDSLAMTKQLFQNPPGDNKEFYRQAAFVLSSDVARGLHGVSG